MKRIICLLICMAALTMPVLGTEVGMVVASDGMLCGECELGDLGADALRAYTGADIALFASGDLGIGLQVCTMREAVAAYLDGPETIQPPEGGRIRVLGANDNPIIGGVFPKGFVLVVAAVAVAFGGMRYRKQMRERTER